MEVSACHAFSAMDRYFSFSRYPRLIPQEKQKWEITSGTRYKTVSDTVSANSSIEYNIKSNPNQLCQHGVKY